MPPHPKARKKKCVIELHLTYEMVYNPESKEIKESLASYNKSINKGGDLENMLVYVAHNVQLEGGPGLGGVHVEGVGWVSVRGIIPDRFKDQYSGIYFKAQPAAPDIDMISNEFI